MFESSPPCVREREMVTVALNSMEVSKDNGVSNPTKELDAGALFVLKSKG